MCGLKLPLLSDPFFFFFLIGGKMRTKFEPIFSCFDTIINYQIFQQIKLLEMMNLTF